MLVRSRIVDQIASAVDAPITAIIGPAGHGKSTALRQFLELRRDPTILFGARPDDDSLVAFARGLIQSSSALTQAALPALHDAYTLAAQSADPGKVLAEWLALFITDLPPTSLIAIDDMQFGSVDPRIPKFVTALIDQTKQRVRWLVSSRSWQDLPIDVWVAQGDMELPVDEVDLEFTPDDVRELAAITSSRTLDAEAMQRLTARLEGWPTALVLALRAGIAVDDIAHNAGSSEQLFSQLVERFFRTLAEQERTFLKVASLLRSIDEQLFLTAGISNVRELSQQFADAGVLVPYGTDGSALRIHDLFTQTIESLFDDDPHDSWRGVAKRICLLLDQRDEMNAAVALCIKLQDTELATDIVRRRGLTFWDVVHAELVDKTIALVDSNVLTGDPVVLAVRGMHLFRSGNVTEGKRQLTAALLRLSDPVTRARIAARLTIGSMITGNVPEEVDSTLLDVQADDAGALSEIAGGLALVLASEGKYSEVRAVIARTIRRLPQMPEGHVALVHFYQWAGFASWLIGDFEESREYEARAARDAYEIGRPAISVFGYTLLIGIGLRSGDELDVLNEYVQERQKQERRAGYLATSGISTLQALACAIAAGDDATVSMIEQELLRDESEITRLLSAQAAKDLAIRSTWNGAFEEARALTSVITPNVSVHEDIVRLCALAMFSAAAGDRDGAYVAAQEAERKIAVAPWFGNHGHQLWHNMSRVYEALALMILGDDERAQTCLLTIDGFTGSLVGGMKAVAEGLAGRDMSRVDEGFAMIKQRRYLGYLRMLEQIARCVARTRASGKKPDN